MLSGLISSLQQATTDGERGHVFAAFGAAFALGQAAGMIAAGILGDRLGAVPLLNVQAICYLAGGLAALVGIAGAGGSPRSDRPADSAEGIKAANASTKPWASEQAEAVAGIKDTRT
jgi:MFS family permease